MLVRGSSARPEPVEYSLARGGAGLKIHEDVGAGPEQIDCALDIADRHDIQLAIHTDGLNEALSVEDTYAAFAGRTVHAYHIEGVGGGHAPNLLELAGRDRILTSSTTPTVPFGRVDRSRAPGDGGRGAPARARRAGGRQRDPAPPGARVDDGRRVGAARPRA